MPDPMRRRVLAGLAVLGAGFWPLSVSGRALAQGRLAPTPSCDDEPTPDQTEGPYYTPRSPRRAVLREAGMAGRPIVLAGRVLSRSCRPIAGAVVDLWHADDSGHYDNDGYRLRGHQITDAGGAYRFETIVPGHYPGRTRHFHVKVGAPGVAVLTTQLYFPGEPGNRRDGLFDPALVLHVARGSARFDMVLDRA